MIEGRIGADCDRKEEGSIEKLEDLWQNDVVVSWRLKLFRMTARVITEKSAEELISQ